MLDRKTPPSFNRNFSFTLLQPTNVALLNGVTVRFISGGGQNVIKIELIYPAGRWFEPVWGTAYFTSQLLSKGTKQKSSFEIAQIFDQYGAHLEISPGLDFVSISLYALTTKLEPVLKLLLELLQDPIFPEKELEQGKTIYLENLKVNNEKTSFVASKLIRKNIFGENHPYGKELGENDVTNLQREQLVDFHKNFFHLGEIIVSGKIDGQSQSWIEELFQDLPSEKSTFNEMASPNPLPFREHLKKDGRVQSSIRLGKKSILRSHQDYFDVLFLNHILGGYFGSRLMKNIREEKGLSYGIYSSLHSLVNESYVVIGADVNNENQELTFKEIKNELRKLRLERINEEELAIAKYHFIGSLQSEITTPFAHADKIKNILLFDLPVDYYQKMIARIQNVSAEDLMRVAEEYFKEESFFEVSAG